MVNVSAFERTFVKLYTQLVSGTHLDIPELLAIPDSHRPVIFRGLGYADTLTVLVTLHETIMDLLPPAVSTRPVEFTTSDNNRLHSDLHETTTDTHIELKLGTSTDVNAGFGPVLQYLLHNEQDRLPTRGDRTRWRAMFQQGLVEEIRAEQDELLSTAADFFTNNYAGTRLPEDGQRLLDGYWLGITNVNEIMSTSSNHHRRIHRLGLTDNHTWRNLTREVAEHAWVYKKFVYTDARRFNFFIESDSRLDALRMTMNHKNSYRFPDGTRVDASLGLGSPSFNGWWTTAVS